MWILFAFGSALFAGLTAILAKCGIRNTDSNVATALRTGVVLVFSWLMVFVVGAQSGIRDISAKVLICQRGYPGYAISKHCRLEISIK
jgi:transporter family protein